MRVSLAALLLAACTVAAGQELGTLFHTPKERDLLERLRRGEKIEPTAITRPDPVVTGFVKRSDGKSTVFLDNQPFVVGDPRDNKLIEPGIVQRYAPPPPPTAPAPGKTNEDRGVAAAVKGAIANVKSAISKLREPDD